MRHKINLDDDDLVFMMERVDRLTVAIEKFGKGSISFLGKKIISWEVGK